MSTVVVRHYPGISGGWIEFQIADGPLTDHSPLAHWDDASLYVDYFHADRLHALTPFLGEGWEYEFASLSRERAREAARVLDRDPDLAELVALIGTMEPGQHLWVLGV